MYKIAIPLAGKGATNHLHRKELVECFAKYGIEVIFFVRDDYFDILPRIDGCSYFILPHLIKISRFLELLHYLSREIRKRYTASDAGLDRRYRKYNFQRSLAGNLENYLFCILAKFHFIAHIFMLLEKKIALKIMPNIFLDKQIDQAMILGIGGSESIVEGYLTWIALCSHISVVHIVGNFDTLSTKGYRGAPVCRLLVWGKNMRRDAELIHNISSEKISEIGSIRYNSLFSHGISLQLESRKIFFEKICLDSRKKTIFFAGFFFESQYFEMLSCLQELREEGDDLQLILRIYPNKRLMHSIYTKPLIEYAQQLDYVAVSIADPNYYDIEEKKHVLFIEEYELWNGLSACDCLINVYSTIAIEGCLFDKPVLYMGYFPSTTGILAREPLYFDYSSNPQNRRLASYSAIETAKNRCELKALIRMNLNNPDRLSCQRKRVVEDEIGDLDGCAHQRLVDTCLREYYAFANPHLSQPLV